LKNILNYMTVCFRGRINFFTLLFVFCVSLFQSSCRKEATTIGDDFVGDITGFDVKSSDTASIIAYTSLGDSIINSRSEGMYYFYLGALNDPEFGSTVASSIMQFSLPNTGGSVDISNASIDSIVLQIKYVGENSFYGSKNASHKLSVYELTENLSAEESYASNRKFAYNASNLIGTWNGRFNNMGDSVKYTFAGASVTLPPHLRIKLDNPVFIQKFKDAKGANALRNNTDFHTYFKGLIVVPETSPLLPGQGSIAYMQLRNGSDFSNITTSVVVYYDSVQKIEFPIYTDENVKAAHIVHNHSVSIPVQPLIGGNHMDENYVQSLGGLKTRILIPNLFEYVKNKNIAITGAQLIVTTLDGGDAGPYSVPLTMRLDQSDSLGLNDFSLDLLSGGATYYGGSYNSSTRQYAFTVTRYINYLLKEYKQKNLNHNYGFNLYIQPNPATASRVIIDTRPGKIKLKLSYTVIN
jgi:hypothetical protein